MGSIEYEDPEKEDPLRKRRPPTKMKTHYENKDPYENELMDQLLSFNCTKSCL